MSLRNRFFTIFTVIAGIALFSIAGFAQDTKTTDKPTTTTDKPASEGREFGGRKFGKEGQEGFGGHHHGPGGMMHGLHGVNLTEEQKTQIHSIMEANRPTPESMQEFRTLAMAKRDGTITADQQTRLNTLRTESRDKKRSIHEQILAVLTPEQKQQIETHKQEMKQQMEQRRLEWQQRKDAAPGTTKKPTDN